jgi:hypothetical protein
MKQLPTAEEFLKSKGLFNDKSIRLQNMGMTSSETMIEFTRLHCEAQKKAIKLKIQIFLEQQGMSLIDDWEFESTGNTVINEAYPLTNIK